jgi:predicted RNase H-like HicB family nuclease
MDYIAVIHKEPNSDSASAFLIFLAASRRVGRSKEARDMAAEALAGHIEVMHETGEPEPDPSTLDEVMVNPDFRDGVAFLVTVEAPGKRCA